MAETDDDDVQGVLSAIELLGPAIKARAVIEQAKVLVMAQTGWDDQRAFTALVVVAQREGRKLVGVAGDVRGHVLATGELPAEIHTPGPAPSPRRDHQLGER